MSFLYEVYTLIRKSDKTLSIFNLDNNIVYKNFDCNLNNLYSENIIDGDFSFADTWFDIDDNDNIYGVVNNKKGKLVNIDIKNNNIKDTTIFKYDYYNYFIKFPFIKYTFDSNHLIYYLGNKYNNIKLIHVYKSNGIYKKNTVDFINHNILNNFVVTWSDNIPTVFYFKVVDKFEELFTSTFDLDKLQWSKPIQLTNSRKNKIYLSIIKSSEYYYHIAFSENNYGKYMYKYLKLYIKDSELEIHNDTYISSNIMCLFPNLVESNSMLYAQWVEYSSLYTCKSNDSGKTWSKPVLSNYTSNEPSLIYGFKSNFPNDSSYNLSSLFTFKDYFDIDSILSKY